MDLWIRTQYKYELLQVNKLAVGIEPETNFITIEGGINDFEYILARYETEARALEVLDEIQKLLTPQIYELMRKIQKKDLSPQGIYNVYAVENCQTGQVDIKELSTIVYQMPKE